MTATLASLSSLRAAPKTEAHPVEKVQRELAAARAGVQRGATAAVFGVGFDVRQRMDAHILAQFRRPHMLPSSHVGIETLLGVDEDIDFADFLGDPVETTAALSLHEAMEVHLAL
jgi:proteasome maturation protein